MNTDIKKLQVLNDLISQTLDAISQRSVPYFGGLSHTSFVQDPRLDPRLQFTQMFGPSVGINPQVNVPNYTGTGIPTGGFSHTPFAPDIRTDPWLDPRFDPRFDPRMQYSQPLTSYPMMGISSGLSHSPYTQTFPVFDPRVVPNLDYRFNVPQHIQPQNLTMGLSHTPYVPQSTFFVPNIPNYIQRNTPWGW